jgi:hypothetical protein
VRLGCRPLLPKRLSYPELLPPEFQAECLYDDPADLAERLAGILSSTGRGAGRDARRDAPRLALSDSMERFAWERVVGAFDDALESLR